MSDGCPLKLKEGDRVMASFKNKLETIHGRMVQEKKDDVWVSFAEGKAFVGLGCYKDTLLAAVNACCGINPDEQVVGWIVGVGDEELNIRFSPRRPGGIPFNLVLTEKEIIWVV